jgi:hypothetical protein
MYYLSSWIPFVQTESCQSVVECKSVNTGRQVLARIIHEKWNEVRFLV